MNDVSPERYVLGSILLRREAVWEALDVIQMDDFAAPRHETIFRAMVSLANIGDPIDVITVVRELERTGDLNLVGGAAYIHDLTTEVTTSWNAGYYAEMMHEEGRRRALVTAADSIKAISQDMTLGTNDMLEAAMKQVRKAEPVKGAADADSELVLEDVLANIGATKPAFRTPWPLLTDKIKGFRRGGLYIVGARPGVGKSVVALQMASHLEHEGHVGYFTMEMSKEEVVKRLVSQQTEVAHSMIDGDNPLPDWASKRIAEWRTMYPGKILFDDRGSLTVGQMRATLRRWSRDYQMSGVVVDYLQLMSGDPRVPKIAQITEISRELKVMAREFNVPIIALSQLNRALEQRADRRPALADLRESGSIEQDADVVLLLSRDTNDPDSALEIIIAKNRQGPTGSIDLGWQGEFMRAVA